MPTDADVDLLIDLAVARVQLELAQQQLRAALTRSPKGDRHVPVQIITDLLRRLPSSGEGRSTPCWRCWARTGRGRLLGVTSIGSVSMSRALELYAYISPAMGLVAVANVGAPPSTRRWPSSTRTSTCPRSSRWAPRRTCTARRHSEPAAAVRSAGRARLLLDLARVGHRRVVALGVRLPEALGSGRLGAAASVPAASVGRLVATAQARRQQADQRRGPTTPSGAKTSQRRCIAGVRRPRRSRPSPCRLWSASGRSPCRRPRRTPPGRRPATRCRRRRPGRAAPPPSAATPDRRLASETSTRPSTPTSPFPPRAPGTPADSHVALLAPRIRAGVTGRLSRDVPLRSHRGRHAARRRT